MRQQGFAHLLLIVLLLAGLVVGVYLVQQRTNFRPRADFNTSTIDSLTTRLENAANPGPLTFIFNLISPPTDDLTDIAKQRYSLMSRLAAQDPTSFLDYAIDPQTRSKLPVTAQDYIETPKTVTGQLGLFHADRFDQKTSTDQLIINVSTANQATQPVDLFIANNQPIINPGSLVQATGYFLDDKLVIDQPSKNLTSQANTQATNQVNQIRLAAILINFRSDTSQPFSRNNVEQVIFGQGGTNQFYAENSNFKVTMNGDVFDWVTINVDPSQACEFSFWSDLADQALANRGVNLTDYNRKIYFFNRNQKCTWDGLGEIYVNEVGRSWVNGWFGDLYQGYVVAHELGHNFGLHHANILRCPSLTNLQSLDCSNQEYGDESDVLGFRQQLFNAPHRYFAGWLNKDQVQDISVSGTYTINPLESIQGVTLLRIRAGGLDPNNFYYLSYRQKIGFDQSLISSFAEGISVHQATLPAAQTKLLQTHPGDPNSSAPMRDGESFVDSNGIRITQISHDDTKATVQIELNTKPLARPENLTVTCDPYGPNVRLSWDRVLGAERYLVRVNKHDNKNPEWYNPPGDKTTNAVTNYIDLTLEPGSNYLDWSVQPFRLIEKYPYAADYSSSGSFSCPKPKALPEPTNLKMACNLTGEVATFSWDMMKEADKYIIRVNHAPSDWAPTDPNSGDIAVTTDGLSFGVFDTAAVGTPRLASRVRIKPGAEYNSWSIQALPLASDSQTAYAYRGAEVSSASFSCQVGQPSPSPSGAMRL